MRKIVVIAHNLRSTHNVGSLLRTANGLGVETVYLTGYTPYPSQVEDIRLPHIRAKIDKNISKTALGAQTDTPWRQRDNIFELISELKMQGYTIAALEQTPTAKDISAFKPPEQIAIIVGREVEGLEQEILEKCDIHLVIPMLGTKESFNVVQAAAMGLYHVRFSR